MHEHDPLPDDLATPTRARNSASTNAGIITGGFLLALCVIGLAYAFTL
ncbi:hypothetical protein PBI_SMARTIES_55 [Microbacterium phage Smarties]|uniref:Uncharacterized protein n=1 Tax=Microbacterium phage Ariadne TaxID=2656546 RepID=A0A649VBF9_9CAUD|nr:hypothetical protein QDA10_gp055 [Microbacterium phage Ariadne]QGJ89459.1 hypothetical protein PBI_ARIADNE_55 [Microbacterium phage Ariadne]QGJ91446.1 hypothetical protein PBI_SMARTIES_55 [Microbacterium phage Smarties]